MNFQSKLVNHEIPQFEKYLPKEDDMLDPEAKLDFNLGDETEQNFPRSKLLPVDPKTNRSVSYIKKSDKITAVHTEPSELDTSAVIEGNLILNALNKEQGSTIEVDKLSSASWRRLKDARSQSAIQIDQVKPAESENATPDKKAPAAEFSRIRTRDEPRVD